MRSDRGGAARGEAAEVAAEASLPAATAGGAVLQFDVYVQPGARASSVAGLHDGLPRIRIAAPPVEGKANAELLRFVAEHYGVPRRQVELVRGESSRRKTLRVDLAGARGR